MFPSTKVTGLFFSFWNHGTHFGTWTVHPLLLSWALGDTPLSVPWWVIFQAHKSYSNDRKETRQDSASRRDQCPVRTLTGDTLFYIFCYLYLTLEVLTHKKTWVAEKLKYSRERISVENLSFSSWVGGWGGLVKSHEIIMLCFLENH